VRICTSLWERPRPAYDISQFPGPIRVPSIRHLLDEPYGTVAIVDSQPGSYDDLNGQDCPRCRQIAAERETAASALS
jgi:hypothetical protein